MPPPVLLSRCDRLGDLILSLPVLAQLREAGFETRVLHCSAYAADVGRWAQHNGLCQALWIEGQSPPALLGAGDAVGLALADTPQARSAFRAASLRQSFAPRTRLSALWNYTRTLVQHRSRVAMSELRYNLQLGEWLCGQLRLKTPVFRGLPALALPPDWRSPVASPDVVLVASNRASARDWPIEKYLELAGRLHAEGKRVDFLLSGNDAEERRARVLADPLAREPGVGVRGGMASVAELIAYLAGAREVISSSTGPLHLAHAAGVAVTGLYPARPKVESFARWRPEGYWHSAPVRWQTIS